MEFIHEEKLDPRQKRTRRLILDAFLELIEEKPFDHVTVQDVTERATINRATFYDHFTDKFALMEFAFRNGFQQMLMKHRLDDAPCTGANVALLIAATCEFLQQFQKGHCSTVATGFDSRFEIQITTQLQEILLHWLEDEPLREMRASVASWAIYGAAVHWKKVHRQMTLDEYIQQVMPIISEAINAPAITAKS